MKIKLLHILKIIKVLTLTLIILSCSNKEIASHDLKKGVYAWREQNIFKSYYYLYLNKTNFEIGDTLTLLDNSDFKYTNCGFFGFGKYLIEGDSLYLNFDSTASHFDSVLTEDKMANRQTKYWAGWNKDAANHFNVAPSTITLWQKAQKRTLDIIIKHNRLLDWITSQLVLEHGVPAEDAKLIVNAKRIGFEKCLED